MQVAESPAVVKLRGECTEGTGPDLTGFPHLVYAPNQWGDGVRCGSNGACAQHVAAMAAEFPIEEAAEEYGVSLAEALDALRWARASERI